MYSAICTVRRFRRSVPWRPCNERWHRHFWLPPRHPVASVHTVVKDDSYNRIEATLRSEERKEFKDCVDFYRAAIPVGGQPPPEADALLQASDLRESTIWMCRGLVDESDRAFTDALLCHARDELEPMVYAIADHFSITAIIGWLHEALRQVRSGEVAAGEVVDQISLRIFSAASVDVRDRDKGVEEMTAGLIESAQGWLDEAGQRADIEGAIHLKGAYEMVCSYRDENCPTRPERQGDPEGEDSPYQGSFSKARGRGMTVSLWVSAAAFRYFHREISQNLPPSG
jgi:hypothetical protein